MKRKFLKTVAALLVAVTALAPITAQAAELKTVKYNPEVTRSNGDLKLGYKATDDATKTWWKTETYYTDWKEATLEEYNAVKDDDLKKVDASGRTDWRKVDKNTYLDYLSKSPDDARTNGYTDYVSCDKATYEAAADDLRTIQYGEFQKCDKATYDAETDPDKKQMNVTDWTAIGQGANWRDAYDEWLSYPEDSRRIGGKSDFFEVSKDEYTAFAETFPGREGDLYYYEDDNSKKEYVEQITEKCKNFEFTSEEEIAKFAKGLFAMYYYENQVVAKKNNSKEFGIDIEQPITQNQVPASNKLKDAISKLNHVNNK